MKDIKNQEKNELQVKADGKNHFSFCFINFQFIPFLVCVWEFIPSRGFRILMFLNFFMFKEKIKH